MKLSTVFKALGSGELHNLHLTDLATFTIKDKHKEEVLRSINLGLIDLYTRFFLRRKIATIPLVSTERVYSVKDNELVEIVEVMLNGTKLVPNTPTGYLMLDTKSIYLGFIPTDSMNLEIVYKAKPKELTEQDITDDTDILLPDSYLNALLYFIGSRLYTSVVNQLDGDLNESNRYAQKYMQEIQMLTNQGIDVDDLDDKWLFGVKGFI